MEQRDRVAAPPAGGIVKNRAPAIRGLLFDKDGTLIAFEETWIPAFCEAASRVAGAAGRPDIADHLLRQAGYDRSLGVFDADSMLANGTNQDLVCCWNSILAEKAPRDLQDLVVQVFRETSLEGLVAVADLPPLFDRLAGAGYRLGIATNDDTELAELGAQKLGIRDHLTFVCGSDGGFGGKPGPGMGEAFCRHTGLEPSQVAMIGDDAAADAGMARTVGFGAAIGVLTGPATREQLEPWFDVVIDSVAHLPDVLAAWRAGGSSRRHSAA